MKRTGYQVTSTHNKEKYNNCIYLDYYQAADTLKLAYSNTPCNDEFTPLTEWVILEVEVMESEDSIDKFYDQIEKENPEYQAELTKAVQEVLDQIETTELSDKEIEEYVDDWLSRISICNENY